MEIILGLIILILIAALVFLFLRGSKGGEDAKMLISQIEMLTQAREADRVANTAAQQALTGAFQQQLSHLTQQLDSRLDASQRGINDVMRHQFAESQKLITEINSAMEGRMMTLTREQQRANESVREFAQIGEKLANLEKTLTHQKQRGAWGERSLELILDNFLVGNYEKQYPITDKDIVDFVIKTPEGLIPVDAKFSLDNYQRLSDAEDPALRDQLERDFRDDLKKRIDETAKYINEKKGTLPFAFMFIPAEAIYYDVLMNKVGRIHEQSMIDYAYHDKHVIIVSPTTFMAYLQTVLYGFKAFQVAKDAQDIIKRVGELGKHLKSYEDYHGKIGTTLGTLVNHYNHSSKQFKLVDRDIERIAKVAPGLDAPLLDKPQKDDDDED
jgi:DNA recombination protein RmuC